MTSPVILASAITGALIGTVLNLVIDRVPRGESVNSGPSRCSHCGEQIRGYDSVPVLGWLRLRGRCRDCGRRISLRYPLIELGTAAFFGLVAWMFAAPIAEAVTAPAAAAAVLQLLAFVYLAAICVALAFIDIQHHRLPNAIVLPAYAVGTALLLVAAALSADWWALLRAAVGMAVLFAFYFVIAAAARGGMGFGDVKLAGVLGLYLGWLGWGQFAVGALGAFLIGGLAALVLMVLHRAGRTTRIPFGPYMLLGAWIGIAFGDQIWPAYLNLFGLPA